MARVRRAKMVFPKPQSNPSDEYNDETMVIAKYILKAKGPEAALEVLDDRSEKIDGQPNRMMDQG